MRCHLRSALVVIAVAALPSAAARAYTVETAVTAGCHERITVEALRAARAALGLPAPAAPVGDDAALVSDLPYQLPADLRDLGGAAIVLGVLDNDLKGNNPIDQFELVPITSDEAVQREHCLRRSSDDEPGGSAAALEACRAFVREQATLAIDALGPGGSPEASRRMTLRAHLAVRGVVDVSLPAYYVAIGRAIHTVEDSFTHTYRSEDGRRVTVVLNWTDYVNERLVESRDGPAHRLALDHCDDPDALRKLRRQLATEAATRLLVATLDPARDRAGRIAAVDAVLDEYLSYQAGCTAANRWCDAPENALADGTGCSCRAGAGGRATGGGGALVLAAALAAVALVARRGRRRRRATLVGVALFALVGSSGAPALAAPHRRKEVARPAGTAPAANTAPADGTAPAADAAPAAPPAVPVAPRTPDDAAHARVGKEPGRDVKTPDVAEVARLREEKRLGSRVGFVVSAAISFDRPAAAFGGGLRVRIVERWLVGLDAEWNPFYAVNAGAVRHGVADVYLTGILRWPMRWERVNLRSSLHLGLSVLLSDIYGAPRGSVGPYVGLSVLGIDFDLGRSLRVVIEPADIALPVPHLTGAPFFYPQYRFTLALSWGA